MTSDIFIGIFASALVLCINSIVGYKIEKQKEFKGLIDVVDDLYWVFHNFLIDNSYQISSCEEKGLTINVSINAKELQKNINEIQKSLKHLSDRFFRINFIISWFRRSKKFRKEFFDKLIVNAKEIDSLLFEIKKLNSNFVGEYRKTLEEIVTSYSQVSFEEI